LESLRKSKNFIAAKFFGPFDVKDQALRKLLVDDKAKYANVESPEYEEWKNSMLEAIPRANHD